MKAIIGQCDLFIGARMHACIGAVSQGVPTACLAYSSKFAGVMQPMGDGAKVLDLRVISISEAKKEIAMLFRNREKLCGDLEERLPTIRKMIYLHMAAL